VDRADFFNERRFLTLDLTCSRRIDSQMYAYLLDNGMTKEEFDFFLHARHDEHCIIGHDYYAKNEHLLIDQERRDYAGEDVLGYYAIARSYHDRYNLPVMHTETNLWNRGRPPGCGRPGPTSISFAWTASRSAE
jgi:hypothetical protein